MTSFLERRCASKSLCNSELGATRDDPATDEEVDTSRILIGVEVDETVLEAGLNPR